MPLFKKDNKNIFLIHIPRSGGRYIRDLLKRNKFEAEGWDFRDRHKEADIEIPHLHYSLFKELKLPDDSKYFAVIRNPIERFKATISHTSYFVEYEDTKYFKRPDLFLDEIKSYEDFVREVEYRNKFLSSNAFLKQKEFLHPNTSLWKFELGFDDLFIKWFNDKFDFDIVKKDILVMLAPPLTKDRSMKNSFDNKIKVNLSKEITEYVNEYYKDDFKIWENIDI